MPGIGSLIREIDVNISEIIWESNQNFETNTSPARSKHELGDYMHVCVIIDTDQIFIFRK